LPEARASRTCYRPRTWRRERGKCAWWGKGDEGRNEVEGREATRDRVRATAQCGKDNGRCARRRVQRQTVTRGGRRVHGGKKTLSCTGGKEGKRSVSP
jgi:hypothetical protein